MEAPAPFDFNSRNNSSRMSSDTTRDLARRQGGIIPEGGDALQRYFQPRFVTHDPPAGSLLASFRETESSETAEAGESKEADTADPVGGNEGTIEQRLMTASTSFDSQVGQSRPGSSMAQARPMGFPYGANVPYPHRRTFDSYSSTHSSAMAPYHSGAGSNDIRGASEDDSHHASREIASRISMLTTYLGRSAAVSPEQSTQQNRLLTEISQMVTSALCNLRFERDNARRDFDRVWHRSYRDNTVFRSDNRRLQEDLNKALSREKATKIDFDYALESMKSMKGEVDGLRKENGFLRDELTRKKQDMQIVEEHNKRLRARNDELRKAAGEKPEGNSSSRHRLSRQLAPGSRKPSALSESTDAHEFLYGMLKKKSDEQESKQNKQKAEEERIARKYARSPEMTPSIPPKRNDSASFNPEAPSFKPPTSPSKLATASDAGPGRHLIGGPSNWPTLVSHSNKTPVKTREDKQPETVVRAPTASEEKHEESSLTMDEVNKIIERIAILSKGYIVRCHKAGHETKVSDKLLSRKEEATWKYLVNLVFADNMFQAESHMIHIMSIKNYRSYLIMRAIQDYLYRKIISPSIFLGFDSKLDQHLAALQDRISQYSNPDYPVNARDRQAVLNDHAKIIDEALKDPRMAAFKQETIDRHTRVLASILQPLRSVEAPDKEADEGIRTLINMSWGLSTQVWTSGIMLIYSFPKCGSSFTEGAMNAANLEAFNLTAQNEPKLLQAKVSFVVTPSVAMRDDRDGNNNGVYGLRKAEVIIAK